MLVRHGQGWVALSASTIGLPAPGPPGPSSASTPGAQVRRVWASPQRLLPWYFSPAASLFDECASRHLKVAEMVVGQAKRLLESCNDVVILLEGIPRLARPSSAVVPFCRKVLSGGAERLLFAPNASSGDPDPADRPVVPCTVFAPYG